MANGHLVPIRFDFKAPHETAVLICERVRDGAPVLYVSHDEEDYWHFLCGGYHSEPAEGDGGLLSCLGCLVAGDVTLNEVADLPHCHYARRAAPGAPWTRHDSHEDFINEAVEKFGWAVQLIPAGEEDEPAFAYTVGLVKTFSHPELIMVGLKHEVMHAVLNACGERVRGGEVLKPGILVDGILERYPVRAHEVHDRKSYDMHVGYAIWFNQGRDFPLLQVAWPDKAGRFPGEPGFDPSLTKVQPILP